LDIRRHLLRVVIFGIGGVYCDESGPQRVFDSTRHIGVIKAIKRHEKHVGRGWGHSRLLVPTLRNLLIIINIGINCKSGWLSEPLGRTLSIGGLTDRQCAGFRRGKPI
jgi:hypothetical protein